MSCDIFVRLAKHAVLCDHLAMVPFSAQCMCFPAALGFRKVGSDSFFGLRYAFGFILYLEPDCCVSRVSLPPWQWALQLLSSSSCPLRLGGSVGFTTIGNLSSSAEDFKKTARVEGTLHVHVNLVICVIFFLLYESNCLCLVNGIIYL